MAEENSKLSIFKNKYNQVFDKNGNISPCGRSVTRELILICEELDSSGNFGNDETGFMEIENIQNLYDKYFSK